MVDRIGRGQLPDLRGAVVGEVRQIECRCRCAAEILADRHDRQRAIGGSLRGENRDVVGVWRDGGNAHLLGCFLRIL